MALIPTHKTDYEEEYKEYTQPADHQTSILPALIEGVCTVIQDELEDNLATIMLENNVANATGALLDHWAEMVGISRNSADDTTLRLQIRGRIRRNRSNGTWQDLIAISRSLYGLPEGAISVSESWPAQAVLEVKEDYATPGLNPDLIFRALDGSRAAGVKLFYIHWPDVEDNLFTFASGSTLVTGDNQKGFSNLIQAQGGRLVGVLSSISSTSDTETTTPLASWDSGFDLGFGG